MSLSTKILVWLGAIFAISALSFIVYKQIEMSQRQLTLETQVVAQKELIDNIVRSQSQYATRGDIENFIKDNNVNLKAIKDDLDKLHAEVVAVNTVTVTSTGQHSSNIPTTNTGEVNPNPPVVDPQNPDPYGYLAKQQNLELNEDFSGTKVPVGSVGFSAWKPAPWSVDILPREYRVVSVLGTDENQRTYVYNKVSIKAGNKSYDVKIKSAETKQVFPEAKWSWWNPRLFMSAGGSVNVSEVPVKASANVALTIGIMSYGKFKTNPSISVLQLGAAYETENQKPAIILNPVNFNVGGLLPQGLINNTYIGPSLQLSFPKDVYVGGNLSVGL